MSCLGVTGHLNGVLHRAVPGSSFGFFHVLYFQGRQGAPEVQCRGSYASETRKDILAGFYTLQACDLILEDPALAVI